MPWGLSLRAVGFRLHRHAELGRGERRAVVLLPPGIDRVQEQIGRDEGGRDRSPVSLQQRLTTVCQRIGLHEILDDGGNVGDSVLYPPDTSAGWRTEQVDRM